ncbi:hypothetical protein CJ030_MR5G017234 [Morella rubra]|uniref:Uncharacterized protein n=1 Tax=Morella rubra TaxID=262757 RepID=A0A6A1VM71_9ROSI|nr:hypothetical protein CJ030_MR5G017234 [Morella rubra]
MEGIKGLGGGGGGAGGRVGVGEEDMGDGMQCSDHPYRNNPGGICAFCLQEKLGKLVSSSFPLPIRGASSSSSSPSFRSDGNGGAGSSSSLSLSIRPTSTKVINDGGSRDGRYHDYYTRRARIPFLLAKKKKKKVTTIASSDRAADIVFSRSKSTTTPRRNRFLDGDDAEDFSPRKRGGFWSFLYFSSSSSKPSASKSMDKSFRDNSKITALTTTAAAAATAAANGSMGKQKEKCVGSSLGNKNDIVEEDDIPNSQAPASASSFERKVSRSRSVGCGSRSFSGDFFERISTGFGDCTLRRVESQREGKPKVSASAVHRGGPGGDHHHHHCMKERVKCGGIFGGFMITSSSSSSSSSSYWVSSSAEDMNGKPAGPLVHSRSKSWGWAFASPMRAFSKPSSKDGKRDIIRQASDKNTTPNLAAIPSLLAVGG